MWRLINARVKIELSKRILAFDPASWRKLRVKLSCVVEVYYIAQID